MKRIFVIVMLSAAVVLAGCASNEDSYAGMSFQEVCAKTGGMWMKMQPTQDFAPTGQPACLGCMQPNGDHICEKERYIQTLQKQ